MSQGKAVLKGNKLKKDLDSQKRDITEDKKVEKTERKKSNSNIANPVQVKVKKEEKSEAEDANDENVDIDEEQITIYGKLMIRLKVKNVNLTNPMNGNDITFLSFVYPVIEENLEQLKNNNQENEDKQFELKNCKEKDVIMKEEEIVKSTVQEKLTELVDKLGESDQKSHNSFLGQKRFKKKKENDKEEIKEKEKDKEKVKIKEKRIDEEEDYGEYEYSLDINTHVDRIMIYKRPKKNSVQLNTINSQNKSEKNRTSDSNSKKNENNLKKLLKNDARKKSENHKENGKVKKVIKEKHKNFSDEKVKSKQKKIDPYFLKSETEKLMRSEGKKEEPSKTQEIKKKANPEISEKKLKNEKNEKSEKKVIKPKEIDQELSKIKKTDDLNLFYKTINNPDIRGNHSFLDNFLSEPINKKKEGSLEQELPSEIAKTNSTSVHKTFNESSQNLVELLDSEVDHKKNEDDNKIILDFIFDTENKKSIQVLQHDLKTIEEMCLINDTIITFYLKFLERYFSSIENKTERRGVYCFNTHFYVFLQDQYEEQIENCLHSYKRLDKWGKCVNVFGCKFVAIPIHENNHWSLIIIVSPEKIKTIFQDVKKGQESTYEAPNIIYFDSFFPENEPCVQVIKRFLIMEFRRKEGVEAFDREYDSDIILKAEQKIKVSYPKVPFQQNTWDCGVYLLAYAELFFRNPDFVLNQLNLKFEDESAFQSSPLCNWFDKEFIDQKRGFIKHLIHKLAEDQKKIQIFERYLEKASKFFAKEYNEKTFHISQNSSKDL